MKMTAPGILISPTNLANLKANYFAYLDAALADVNAGAPAHMATWFGALGAGQITTLRDGLQKLKDVARNYKVSATSPTTERRIAWMTRSGDFLHSEDTYAGAFAYGVATIAKHFTLRIYSGFLLAEQTYDWIVNTMYHELSHRVLATADVTDAITNNEPAYGQVHVQALAANNTALALQNASNWAYYINACNNQTNWPI